MNLLLRRSFALLLGLLVLWGPSVAFARKLLISTSHIPPRSNPQDDGYEDLIVLEAFRRIGVEISILRVPSARGLADANEGFSDGNYGRVAGMEQRFPNLIMIPEKLCDFIFTVFAKDKTLRVPDWSALKPFNVAFITGWFILEKNIVNAKSITQAKNDAALFNLLAQDRADLVVYDLQQGYWLIKQLGLTGVVPLSPPLATQEMFLYLNRNHADLAPALSAALASMREEGVIQKLSDNALRGLASP